MLLWWLPAVPLAAGALLCVLGRRVDRWAPGAALAVAALSVVLAVAVALVRPAVAAPWLSGLPFALAVDGLSAALVVAVAVVTLAVLVHSAGEFGQGRFFGLMLLFSGAMLLTVVATGLLPLLVGWELMGATSYALIGYWWRDDDRVRSGTTAFVTTRFGDLGLYAAAGAAFAASGSLDLAGLATLPTPWSHVVTAGVLVAAAGKSAQLPFSFWLSGAMAGPSPVSALLHSATMVAAGGYLLLRLSSLLHVSGWGATTAAWLGATTAIALGAVACVQRDLKQLLAASTSAQVGLMVLAAGTGAVAGGTAHLVSHAAVKSLLFLAAGTWLTVLGTTRLAELRGAARRNRLVGVAFVVGALALAGVPPLSLWVSKDLALAGAPPPLHVAGLAAGALSAGYAGRALFVLLRGSAPEGAVPPVAVAAKVALVGLAVPAAGLGVVLLAVPGLVGPLHPVPAVVSAAVAVVAVVVVRWWPRRPLPAAAVAWGERWLWLEPLAHRAVVRPVLALAATLAAFDDRVLGSGVAGLGDGTRRAARLVDRRVERGITAGVDAVGSGGRRFGGLARRPQTGQLHHYYAQAAVVLFLIAVAVLIAG